MNGIFPSRSAVFRSRHRRFLGVAAAVGLLLTGSPLAAAAAAPVAQVSAAAMAGSKGVFAIDNDHQTVVFIPIAGGAPRPVTSGLTHPTEIAASRKGSVFIVDGTRLLKVNPHGVVSTIRTGMAPNAYIAVDDNNWLFVHDGTSIVKYSPLDGSLPVSVATGASHGYFANLTIDAVGNASETAANPSNDASTQTLITTYPVRGGKPIVRTLVEDYDHTDTFIQYPDAVVESRDGTIYAETAESGASGATLLYRVPKPGPSGLAIAYSPTIDIAEYVFTVDSSSRFYVMENRTWCSDPARDDGVCVDDYAVNFVREYPTSGSSWVDVPVKGVDLPVGGIAVASSGAIYGAVLLSRNARSTNSTAVPRMLRIDPAGGQAVTLAKGHFSMPVAEDFFWYAR